MDGNVKDSIYADVCLELFAICIAVGNELQRPIRRVANQAPVRNHTGKDDRYPLARSCVQHTG